MKIWVDADACPRIIKEILYRAANRVKIHTTFVANVDLSLPESPYLTNIMVEKGFDVADTAIVENICQDDLVITADIPLAALAVERGAFALNPRGEFYTVNNVRQKLAMRNLMSELRDLGEKVSGPPPLNQRDRQKFANRLDRFLSSQRGVE